MFRFFIVLLALALPAKAAEIPQEVHNCLGEAKRVFIDVAPTYRTVVRFVDPEAALRGIRNPVTDKGIKQVYTSTYRFARFVYRESKKRMGNGPVEMHITRYRQSSTIRIIEGRVGNPAVIHTMTRFTITLAGSRGCRASNFIIAGMRGMLDDVPRP